MDPFLAPVSPKCWFKAITRCVVLRLHILTFAKQEFSGIWRWAKVGKAERRSSPCALCNVSLCRSSNLPRLNTKPILVMTHFSWLSRLLNQSDIVHASQGFCFFSQKNISWKKKCKVWHFTWSDWLFVNLTGIVQKGLLMLKTYSCYPLWFSFVFPRDRQVKFLPVDSLSTKCSTWVLNVRLT